MNIYVTITYNIQQQCQLNNDFEKITITNIEFNNVKLELCTTIDNFFSTLDSIIARH